MQKQVDMVNQSSAKPADDAVKPSHAIMHPHRSQMSQASGTRPIDGQCTALMPTATTADYSAIVAEFDRLWEIDTTGHARARMDELLLFIQEFEKNRCLVKHSDCDAS